MEPAENPRVSVRFGPAGRTQSFLLAGALDPPLVARERVVVHGEHGPAIAEVQAQPAEVAGRREAMMGPAMSVRRVTAGDLAERLRRDHHEREARAYAIDRIRAHALQMKLSRVEEVLDGSRLIFYFTSDTRIDFRELVRELAARFRTRIEMRQIGVRDEARLLGGYGSCGRPLCCTTWLTSFEPVSIRMAKQQDLSLNPSKLSGLCGRLKCCLRYELPNSKGVVRGGCGEEGGCNNPTGCGTGSSCGSNCSCGRSS